MFPIVILSGVRAGPALRKPDTDRRAARAPFLRGEYVVAEITRGPHGSKQMNPRHGMSCWSVLRPWVWGNQDVTAATALDRGIHGRPESPREHNSFWLNTTERWLLPNF